MARFLVFYPCEDACGEITTGRTVEGAPVYRCPGCDSEWIELWERKPELIQGATSDPPSDEATQR